MCGEPRVMTNEQRLEAELERTRRVVVRLSEENQNLRAVVARIISSQKMVAPVVGDLNED